MASKFVAAQSAWPWQLAGLLLILAAVRVIASLRWEDSLAERLGQAGWYVSDRDFGRMAAIGDFEDLEAARAAAARDLPAGVPVLVGNGGFVVGHDDLVPPPGDLLPAYVVWPDGQERLVETRDELAEALRERVDWLCERARELDVGGVEDGHRVMVNAIDAFAAEGNLANEARGPVLHAGCTAAVESVARLRWDGFQRGLESVDGRPAEERRHPIYPQLDGALTDAWREGFRAGAAAATERLSPEERALLASEPTEQDLRARWIDDPEVRVWSREVNAESQRQLREVKRLSDEGDRAGARSALAAMRTRLTAVIAEAEADERPAAAKLAAGLRRLAGSTDRLADELARGESP